MLVNKEKDIVQCAAVLACELHKGQVDKAGVDYFTGHLTTVAKMGSTWKEQVVGYLHDASEDTSHSVEEVLNLLDAKLRTPYQILIDLNLSMLYICSIITLRLIGKHIFNVLKAMLLQK